MSLRKILVICLILITLIAPLIELSIGFYYIKSVQLCPLQRDIMLLMSIGGVFELIFLSAASGFVVAITPALYKIGDKKPTNRITQCLIGVIMCIFAIGAGIFFVLLQIRVYGNFNKVQTKSPGQPYYCLFTIFYGAFGTMIGLYVSIILLILVTVILLLGIGV